MSLAVAVRRKATVPSELLAHCFHTTVAPQASKRSSSQEGKRQRNSSPKPSSRTRLVKDLKPRTGSPSSSRLRVAPKPLKEEPPPPPPLVRDAAPHHEAKDTFMEWEQRRIAGVAHKERLARRAEQVSKRPTSWQRALKGGEVASREYGHTRPSLKGKERASEDDPTASASVDQDVPRKRHVYNPLSDEFDVASKSASTRQLPTQFSSPPLMDGLRASVLEALGPDAKPSPIQALSMKHLFSPPSKQSGTGDSLQHYHQCLLASETGSGKSIAYLLPMLQDLKQSELQGKTSSEAEALPAALNPRGIVLAPTHELSRQLSGFAKALLHEVKLRVICASQANIPSTPRRAVSASDMARDAEQFTMSAEAGVRRTQVHPVDVVVGTPSKILEMINGRGWDYEQPNVEDSWDKERGKVKSRPWTVGKPEMSGSKVEWVVVDEADVLFDPDFQEHTRRILAEISEAKGHPVPFESELSPDMPVKRVDYPFNLLLTTATIPAALATYLDTHHPSLLRLASPNLHHLPATLQTEYAGWTGGNKSADVEHRLRRVWADDGVAGATPSKVLVFCNKSTRVEELGQYLQEKGIPNIALTSTSEARRHGSNHHLDGFLKGESVPAAQVEAQPRVMITTSLLSRGLDFSPDIKHVFIVDEPRNMVDFLHRAGRSGRAGEKGKVVVFGKMKGRGSESSRVMKQKVRALAA